VVGFAHRFRPTYPGFPVDVGGVEQLRAAFFERKPHAWSWLVRCSGNPGNAGANVGHPYRVVAPETGLRGRSLVSHISRRTSEMWDTACLARGYRVGRPALVAGIERQSVFLLRFTWSQQAMLNTLEAPVAGEELQIPPCATLCRKTFPRGDR
jgi:hypothetical protein